MHDSAYEVRRMILPRTPMNRALEYWETAAFSEGYAFFFPAGRPCAVFRAVL
jgi:hypothetical protein